MKETQPKFPDTYADRETELLLDVYRQGPKRLRLALEGLAEAELRARPIEGKWSALEIAIHVADSEVVGAARMRMVMGADDPDLPGYDQDRWSRDLRYGEASGARLESSLKLFEALRDGTLPLLESASDEDWTLTGVHPERGRMTLRNLLELYADHSERHVAQILTRRELLGAPLEMPQILPERLY